MDQTQLTHQLLEQGKDRVWMVDFEFQLIYANKAYLTFMEEVTGVEKKLNESILVEGMDVGYTEKWKAYHERAFKGESFEIEEHFFHPESGEIQYSQTTFEPLRGDDLTFFAISCQSKDITRTAKRKYEANQMIDASLDVFCTINEQCNFMFVSAESLNLWGYLPEELIGKSYLNLILEEDLSKTIETVDAVLDGRGITSFVNRYKKKDGDIAYNFWSVRWDESSKLMHCVARDTKDKIGQEEKILQSKQRFKALIQEGYDLFAIINLEGNYVYISPASTGIIGISSEKFIGRDVFEFVHPDDSERTLASLKKSATEERIIVVPYREKNHKNEWRWVETVLTNMIDDPSINGIILNARDITDKVEQEERIQQNEQRFKALVENGSDMIGILDKEGNYIYVSPTSSHVLGITPKEFIGRNVIEFIHPDDVEITLVCLQKIATESKVFVQPFRFQNNKKEWRWLETVLTNMLDNSAVKGIIANSRDITDKIEEKHQLKLLESVITNTNDAVLITEAEPFDELGPKIIYVNEAFTRMTGYSAAEVIGKSPRILQGPNSNKEELTRLSLAIKNCETYEITTINYKKNGEEFWINFIITPVASEEGRYTHWIAIERDVTEQKIKELEQELTVQISINFHTDNDLTSASDELCKSISNIGDFDWVELWTINLDKSQIQLFSHYMADPADEKFYDDSSEFIAYKKSEGLSGKVWSEGVQVLWNDVEKNKGFIRRDAAKKIGLKSVMGIPLIFNGEVMGVLIIGTKRGTNYLSNYTKIFQRLEGFIGSMLDRKKLENDLKYLFKAIPDILCLLDFQGKFLKINKAGCDLLGFSQEELLYHSFEEFVHSDDKEILSNQVRLLEKEENRFKFENRFVTNSGDIVWLSWYCNSTLREGLIYATAKNITEEKKLWELNQKARSLAKIGSWELDLVNQRIFWSSEVHQMHETDPISFVPDLESAINFYRPDFRQLVQTNIEECISNGEPFNFEAVLVTTKKKEIWVQSIGNPEFADGKCTRIYGSFQDINDQKESENRLLSISDNLPGIVYQYVIH
jgi:PAS domain S-box-containing protein